MLQAVQLPTRIADLDTGLSNVQGEAFTLHTKHYGHENGMMKGRNQHKNTILGSNVWTSQTFVVLKMEGCTIRSSIKNSINVLMS